MRKPSQKFILLAVLTLTAFALVQPTPQVEAAPAPDCDAIAALCRIASAIDYDICILKGGDPTDCAWKEAEQTINCIKNAGCGDQPKGPGDN